MEKDPQHQHTDLDQLGKRISDLERRLSILEKRSSSTGARGLITFGDADEHLDIPAPATNNLQNESVESRIGEYGMAWLGNIVLLIGILFLTQLLLRNGQEVLSLGFGFTAVAGIYLAGYLSRNSIPYMSRLFTYNGHIMLYIISMRMHAFAGSRIIESTYIGYGVVLLVIVALTYLAFRNRTQVLAVITWIMAMVTAIYSPSIHLMLLLMVGVTGTSIFFTSRYGWWTGLIISMVLVYCTFLIWITGNPVVNGSFEIITDHQYGYIYLFTCALAYSFMAMLPKSDRIPGNFLTAGIILNGLGFSFILTIAVLSFFSDNYFIYLGLIAAFSMAYSVLLQTRASWKPIAAMYAIYSFVALSITIGGIYKFPLAFFLLSIQSLLVVSMALWFRSRFIVIMNTLLFTGLLIAYLATPNTLISIDFAFAFVALVTARIMNWKKTRLEIRTEFIRNIYLFTGASMLLFSLHQAVPTHFVTLSWALTAMLFFVLSVVIKNMKYRWLAIITMIVTVFYLFIVDLKNISLGYRIVALLFISIISLGISFFYTRRLKSKKEGLDESG